MGRRILIALLIVGLAASGYVAVQRHRVESRNKAVEIVVDWDEVQQIAAATGNSPSDVLKRFKAAGVTSVAIAEQTFQNAIDNGQVTIAPNGMCSIDGRCARRILGHLKGILPHPPLRPPTSYSGGHVNVIPPDRLKEMLANASRYIRILNRDSDMPLRYLEQLPVGLPEDALAAAKQARVGVVARLVAYPGATPKAIGFMMADAKAQGARAMVFQGDTVLGFKGAVEATAKAMRANGLYFGRIEFAKQKGDETLADKARDRVIIVHSITQAEMPALNEAEIVDRFQKGVRERGVRMCYIRIYFTASDDLVESNASYINAVAKSITKAGYTLAAAHLLGEVNVPRFVRALAGVEVAAGGALLILAVVDSPGFVIPALLVLVCGSLAATGEMGRKAVALLSALTFPTLAVLLATRGAPESPTPAPNVFWRAIGRLVWAIAVTAAGGLLIVGLLSGRDFMLRTDQFVGVKAAHLLPVLALAILYVGQVAWRADNWPATRERFWKSLGSVASNPVLIWQAVGMLAALVIVGLVVARSGNDAGVGVSDVELRLRSILDKVLYVRPRTKEFLIGYPALVAGIAFALRGRRQYAAPLVVVGSIGLISALNTFCHIHAPIQLSLIRLFNGAVVGILVGVLIYWLIRYLPGKESAQ